MKIDDTTLQLYKIFSPGLIEKILAVKDEQKKFVYYTSADTAMKILQKEELWFRNATTMNDFSEISYGLELIRSIFAGQEGEKFKEAVDNIFSGTIEKTDELRFGWLHDWQFETYIACISMHSAEEDKQGRLSMWRAYGDTALVINNTPMMQFTSLSAVFSIPVSYMSKESLAEYLSKVTKAIITNMDYLKDLGQDMLVACIHNMFFQISIGTKHPGFKEENEWRLYYRPTQRKSPNMTEKIVVLKGVPQKIFKLQLKDDPKNELIGADIPSLLDHIIIGPTEFSDVIRTAFVAELESLGVEDAASKVVPSDIPLRKV